MGYSISVDLGKDNHTTPGEEISPSVFGTEFLGWEYFTHFRSRHEQIEPEHIRWPGGIPIEDGINTDESADGSREHVYDLRHDNLVEWDRHTGNEREGLRELMAFANQHDNSFAMVAPTARYVEQIYTDGEDAGLESARADIRYFTERLVNGEFGELPSSFTIELGSEYYSTDVWKEQTTDENGTPYSHTPDDLTSNFGNVFAVMADEIDKVLKDPELNPNNVDLNIAVQLGRVGNDPAHNGGSYSDNLDFIEALVDVGSIDAVDSLIYHRYVPTFDTIGRGIAWNSNGHNLGDTIDLWEEASGGQEYGLVAGYLAPSAQGQDNIEHNAPGLTNLLQMNSLLLAEGLDIGTVFGLSHGTGGALGWRSNVFLGGQLHGLMTESLPGKYLVDGYQDNTSNVVFREDTYVVSNDINSYVYENDDEVVVFLAAKDFEAETLDYSLDFDTNFSFGEVTRLWDSGESIESLHNDEIVGNFGNITDEEAVITDGEDGSSVQITFNHDYEIIRLTLDKELSGTEESEEVSGFNTSDLIMGRLGDDIIDGRLGDDKINGNEGKDIVSGGDGDDTVKGGWGDDTVHGGGGDDRVTGDWGNDFLEGNSGNDRMYGGLGADTIFGGQGHDFIKAGFGADRIFGGDGNDTIVDGHPDFSDTPEINYSSMDMDFIHLGNGNDVYIGNAHSTTNAADTIQGEAGHDTITAGSGDDMVLGGDGDDQLFGGDGSNVIIGGAGDDVITATGDSDYIIGGEGNDTIHAESDNATIWFDYDANGVGSDEQDIIEGFVLGDDFIEFYDVDFGNGPGQVDRADFIQDHSEIIGSDLEITLEDGHQIVLKDVVDATYDELGDFYQVLHQADISTPEDDQGASSPEDDISVVMDDAGKGYIQFTDGSRFPLIGHPSEHTYTYDDNGDDDDGNSFDI